MLSLPMSVDTQVRWALRNGMWVMGAESTADLARKFHLYTLAGIADRITAPALVLDAENDQFFKGEPARAAEAMVNSKTTLVTLRESEGAGEHCHMGAMGRARQVIFDWLDDVLAQTV